MSELTPTEKLNNIAEMLLEQADESPFTQEEWDRIDKENVKLTFENNELKRKMKFVHGFVSEIYAVELLQYHNKNWLFNGTKPAELSKEIQEKLEIVIKTLSKHK